MAANLVDYVQLTTRPEKIECVVDAIAQLPVSVRTARRPAGQR